jgi:hypothetical protein
VNKTYVESFLDKTLDIKPISEENFTYSVFIQKGKVKRQFSFSTPSKYLKELKFFLKNERVLSEKN